jgi:hypothetical protein
MFDETAEDDRIQAFCAVSCDLDSYLESTVLRELQMIKGSVAGQLSYLKQSTSARLSEWWTLPARDALQDLAKVDGKTMDQWLSEFRKLNSDLVTLEAI